MEPKKVSSNRIENLPPELIDYIITAALFSEPLGSHDALHTLESLSREWRLPNLKRRITIVFESLSLRKEIQFRWQLYPDFGCAEQQEGISRVLPYRASRDLVSWAIFNCPNQCLRFLLDRGSVRASSFCKTGESLFGLAVQKLTHYSAEQIVSLMDPKNLLEPYSLREPRKTILQFSTIDKTLFEACWKQVKLLPVIDPSFFRWREIFQISRFASVGLAEDLLHRGVDLGKTCVDNATRGFWHREFPVWRGVLGHEDPLPMVEWLWRRGHRPPAGFFEYVVKNNYYTAVSWVIRQTESYQVWQEAACIAAENTDSRSVGMLEFLLEFLQPWRLERIPDNSFTQSLVIKIVDKVCDEVQSQRSSGLRDQTNIYAEEDRLEMDAALKILHLREAGNSIGVAGLNVRTRNTGLYQLTEALENIEYTL